MPRATPDPPADLVTVLARAATGAAAATDETEDRILDAALAELAQRGTRATTMDHVAARAGVARMTVFRRFGSKAALVERLLVREVTRFLATVQRRLADHDDPVDRVAEAFVLCVRLAAGHPLVARLTRDEPGGLLEQLTHGDPSPLELGRSFVAATIRADHPSARVRDDADDVADVLVRLALTYVLVPGGSAAADDDEAVRAFARRVLGPLVT
ncbi:MULTISPECIES: TetR/AcrR family transcriptional regulator [Solirubrobacterales]|uniref:TetR/AcrR family transcriptional regulator n=1 Tax=Solirubrobacterales TaxID=588673 RepID=UPI00130499BD|nr:MULTISPECIES: TetR/AcrR family transcriptional regulator [Solirubrobacterales]